MTLLSCDEQGTARRYFGKYAGIVVDHDDDASAAGLRDVDRKRGEICVDVPGILEEHDDEEVPADAQETKPPANPRRPKALRVVAKPSFMPGFFFIPEQGEHVWLEFVAGDIDHAIWTGMWYPGTEAPDTVAGTEPTRFQKVIRTKSGHVVQLDDTTGEEKVVINHKTGAFVSIDKNGSVIIGNPNGSTVVLNAENGSVVIVDENQNSVRMTADGVVVVTGDGKAAVTLSGEMARVTAKNIALEGTAVALGKGAKDPTILASTAFQAAWQLFINHTHATAVGPTGTPLPPPVQLALAPGVTLSAAATVS